MTLIRTRDELERALWAEKRMNVTEGTLFTDDDNSPFPIAAYFKAGLLGQELNMVEVNAGHAMVENIVSDTLTDFSIKFYKDKDKKTRDDELENEYHAWREENEYDETMAEFMRSFYGAGYGVSQPMRMPDPTNKLFNLVTVTNIKPSSWYPDIPTFTWQPVTSGRIITCFSETKGTTVQWYALVERHTIGKIQYQLFKIKHEGALDGESTEITAAQRFAGLEKDTVDTMLPYLGVSQQNRAKQAGFVFGNSVLRPVWSKLLEVTEFQTQIRQERIKHFRSKMYTSRESVKRATDVPTIKDRKLQSFRKHSKRIAAETGGNGATYDATQDVFIIPVGATPPGFIKWDTSIIEAGSKEIDKILSRAAAMSGFPRSIFNLDEKGLIHAETDRRNNRRYVAKVIQGQRRAAAQMRLDAETWYRWRKGTKADDKKEGFPIIEATLATPFDLSQTELVEMYRKMNPDASFVSQKEAMRKLWPGKNDSEIEAMMVELKAEGEAMLPANSSLSKPPQIDL